MTPEDIREAYAAAGVTKVKEIVDGVKKSIAFVEKRIGEAYENYPAHVANEKTQEDRKLLKAQLQFLSHLERRR